jgi:hypothetical protein
MDIPMAHDWSSLPPGVLCGLVNCLSSRDQAVLRQVSHTQKDSTDQYVHSLDVLGIAHIKVASLLPKLKSLKSLTISAAPW